MRTRGLLALAIFVITTVVLAALPAAAIDTGTIRETGVFHVTHRAADGGLLWEGDADNVLADGGEQAFLNCVLRATSCPTTFYLRLYNDTPVETDTLSTLTGEPTTNGYAAQELTRDATGWPTLALDSGDYQATSRTVTFNATGGSWGPVTYLALATSTDTSGVLVSYAALSTSRTLAAGESLQVTYRLKLQ